MNLIKNLGIIYILVSFASCGIGQQYCDNNDNTNAGCELFLGNTEDGQNGLDGKDGKDGKDGQVCTVKDISNGALLTCGSSSVFIANGSDGLNGANGVDGKDGQDGKDGLDAPINPYSVTEIIDPCGDYPNHYDEVLLKMYDGTIVAYFEDRGKRFLSTLASGNFQTTDKQKCPFNVNNGNVTW